MTTVSLRFAPLAEHVRTARLVAVAVARRTGADDADLDSVRLAVGEICARAVRRTAAASSGGVRTRSSDLPAVTVEMSDAVGSLVIVVTDGAGAVPFEDEDVSLALIRGLADSVEVDDGPAGPAGVVRVRWTWPSKTSHPWSLGPQGHVP